MNIKIKNALVFVSVLALSLSSLLAISPNKTLAVTRTWTGLAGDHNLATAGNWSGGVAPSAGDVLVFPVGAGVTDKALNNDFTAGTSFSDIAFNGTLSGSEASYTLGGNDFEVVSGIVVSGNSSPTINADMSLTGDQTISTASTSTLTVNGDVSIGSNEITFDDHGNSISIDGDISGSGSIFKMGVGTLYLSGANSSLSGIIVVDDGSLSADGTSALGGTAAGTTINSGADLTISTCNSSLSVGEDITLNGVSSNTTGDFPKPKLKTSAANCSGGGAPDETYGFNKSSGTVTLTGDIVLGSDVTFGTLASTTTLSGGISGSYSINLIAGYTGKLIVNASPNTSSSSNNTYIPGAFNKTLSDSQPSSTVGIYGNSEIVITGVRGDVTVNGGTLKGNGTVAGVSLSSGSLKPGLSPGILNTGNLVFSGGTHEVELGGTLSGQYDQLNVSGTVSLGSDTTLSTVLYNGFKPSKGNSFTIINNDGSDAVTGTFNNLPEGATFTVDGYVMKITYVGGSGNDVVLIVQSIPGAPDTGFMLIKSNPVVSLVATTLGAGAIYLLSRRYKRIKY